MKQKNHITVYESISGWKAVELWWNPNMGGFWEPWQTGLGAYATREEALAEARDWAESDGLELRE